MKLVDTSETFEREYTEIDEEVKPVFIIRKLTAGEVETIGDSTSVLDDKNRITYLGGTSIRLKIKFALVGWKNVVDNTGKDASCNDINKEKLPPNILSWLSKEIDELSGLTGIAESDKKKS